MIRAAIICVLLMFAGPCVGQSVKLTGAEITELLTGNTAVGKWDGVQYRQFFNADGSTIYAQQGARSALGQWRINEVLGEYQSIWPSDAEWEGWFVMEFSDDYYWVSKKTPPTPFTILQGEQLVPE